MTRLLAATIGLGLCLPTIAQPPAAPGGPPISGSEVGVQTVRRLPDTTGEKRPPDVRIAAQDPAPVPVNAASPESAVADPPSSPLSAPPAPSPTLSIDDAVAAALEHNPQITAYAERVTAARAVLEKVRSGRAIQVRALGDALLYGELPGNKKQMLGDGDADILISLEASRVLYSNLLDGQIDAATAGALVVLQQYGRLQQEIRFLAISAYYDVQRALRRREVDQEAVAAMQAHSELSEKLLQIGKIPELDVLRVHVQLADVRQRLVTAQNAVELALLRLRNAMGISDDVALSVEAPPANLAPELSPTPLLDELLSRAYAERPEAVAAEAQIARYEAEQRQAAAGLRPEVRAIASYYREGTSLSLDYDNWYLGVRASLPLRDGRGTKYAVDAAKANRRAAEADLETVRQRIRLEVNEAWLLIREASERIIATQAAVQEATRALEIERRRYELGMNTVLDVLDTQTYDKSPVQLC